MNARPGPALGFGYVNCCGISTMPRAASAVALLAAPSSDLKDDHNYAPMQADRLLARLEEKSQDSLRPRVDRREPDE